MEVVRSLWRINLVQFNSLTYVFFFFKSFNACMLPNWNRSLRWIKLFWLDLTWLDWLCVWCGVGRQASTWKNLRNYKQYNCNNPENNLKHTQTHTHTHHCPVYYFSSCIIEKILVTPLLLYIPSNSFTTSSMVLSDKVLNKPKYNCHHTSVCCLSSL
jgi:hypothetical protein